MTPSVFGDYDIRGRYPQEINEGFFRDLAGAICETRKPRRVAIGRDSRRSSIDLVRALGETFREFGVHVFDLGLTTTPGAAWFSQAKKIDTMMVTASHNPANDNGLKIYSRKGEPVAGEELKLIEGALANAKYLPRAAKLGSLKSVDFIGQYQRYLLRIVGTLGSKSRVALDFLHGSGSRTITRTLEQKKINFTTIREYPSGDFPTGGPNPLAPENQKELSFLIKSGRYHLGAIFDGDADRVVFLDETGAVIPAAFVAALFCDYLFDKKDSRRIAVVPINFSRIIDDVAHTKKGRVYRSKVGRINLRPLMRTRGAIFGAEVSGHYFFKKFSYGDSGELALLYLLKILAKNPRRKLSELLAPYKKYTILPEENIPYVEGSEQEVVKTVRAAFPGGKTDRTDGLTVHYEDWWFNLRRSRTEPLWRLSVEALDESLASEKLAKIKEFINLPAAPKPK